MHRLLRLTPRACRNAIATTILVVVIFFSFVTGRGGPGPNRRGCLPADQSCFAVSIAVGAPYSSRHDAATVVVATHTCCTTTSYIAILGISFGSLLVILLILCTIRWYLVQRSARRDAAEAAAVLAEPEKKPPMGLDAEAIVALPEFTYRKEDADREEEREFAVCLGAMAEGDAARRDVHAHLPPRLCRRVAKGALDMPRLSRRGRHQNNL
ncbi:unnamed protein product [Miscanthus lutarioriparius]|uniref:Uncharacterized protein n=1 Tax=Miscanthus lutarioriparius TaxID=422564 RepID=A0A811RZP5_9POAL|nr:unnamed protein product [Miscanthus lutarioriparius]